MRDQAIRPLRVDATKRLVLLLAVAAVAAPAARAVAQGGPRVVVDALVADVGIVEAGSTVEHTFGLYVIKVRDRDAVRAALTEAGIGTGVYYPKPLPSVEVFAGRYQPGDFPVAERLAAEVLALPMFPHLSDAQVDEVISAVITAAGT